MINRPLEASVCLLNADSPHSFAKIECPLALKNLLEADYEAITHPTQFTKMFA
jgi:hypothetical protein